ncbi:MAG: helix-turn-helix domain-containing protein [Methanotrichaceae archaeon]
MKVAYKFRMYPNKQQAKHIQDHAWGKLIQFTGEQS